MKKIAANRNYAALNKTAQAFDNAEDELAKIKDRLLDLSRQLGFKGTQAKVTSATSPMARPAYDAYMVLHRAFMKRSA